MPQDVPQPPTRTRRGAGGAECLKRRAAALQSQPAPRRREELIEWAEDELGVDRELAEAVYQVAREEQVEPGLLLELVGCRVGLRPETAEAPDVPSLDPTAPDWITDAPEPGDARREGRLRASARRLRALAAEHADTAAVLRAFATADDLDEGDY